MRWPDLAIEPPERDVLTQRDAAFARALETATIARWRTLEALLSVVLRRQIGDLEPRVHGALLGGAAQLFLMDRVPDHAAVSETVAWCKRKIRPGAAGFVNGVLRALIRLRGETLEADDPAARAFHERRDLLPLSSGKAVAFTQPVFSEDPTRRLGEQASIGEALLRSWISVGFDIALARASHSLMQPPITLHRADGTAEVFTASHAELVEILATEPAARVQDRGSAQACECARNLSPKLIIDFCAGRGTKTRQLAAMHPKAIILAHEVDEARRVDLYTTVSRLPNARVPKARELAEALREADLVLFDVPCTNTGVLPRRPQARYRFSTERTRSVRGVQKAIVAECMVLMKPAAHVLYATCSLEPDENTQQAKWINKRFGAECLTEGLIEPEGQAGDLAERYGDGGYHALFAMATP